MKLLSFSVSNFKSIGANGGKIEILPVTVLVGENGAGKSSMLEALAFIAQRARKKALGRYELSGEYIGFSNINEMLFRSAKDRSLTFWLVFALSNEETNNIIQFTINADLGLNEKLENLRKLGISENDERSVNKNDLISAYTGLRNISKTIADSSIIGVEIELDGNNGNPLSLVVTGSRSVLWAYRKQPGGAFGVELPGEGTRLYLNVGSDKIPVFGPIFDSQRRSYIFGGRIRGKIGEPLNQSILPDNLNQVLDILPTTESWIISALARIFYLRAPRGHLISTVTAGTSDQPLDWAGNSPVDLGRFLTRVFGEPGLQKSALPDIKRWAQEFGINAMNAASYGTSELNLDYTDDKLVVDLGMKGLGYGSSQVLPIIAQGFASESDSILAIEEPEISLHPNAQVRMLDMFAELVKNRKSIIFTTHSATMLMGLSRLVENGIQPEKIAVYEVEKTESGSQYNRLLLNQNGFIQGWVSSYAEAEKHLLDSWVNSVPEEPDNP
jgi:predicted ATPase